VWRCLHAILDAPDPAQRKGIRDRAMLDVCYMAGLRVSELIGLRLDDLTFQPQGTLLIHGKGRRERCLPLWKTTSKALRAWLAVRGSVRVPELFVNARGEGLTRSGVDYLLRTYARIARQQCPSLTTKRVFPTPVEAHLCPHRAAGNQRSAKGLAVARTRAHANHGNLHARGSIGETGSPGVGGTSEAALRTVQGHRQANRLLDIALRYAE
jgi:integrase/recombinase XerD